ncbi:phosphate ABC transporter permease PstA [Virgibacillus sp. MSJ-26]|uniref:phosphate ABC transporter permease PstA n=1 Tax=Virgibacillus sp. MSJ-26 TaxID=2841522 RepID=UPI001C110C58|nr:phosphate ABC transporter permease PstA [Virgibacillus sp. MSJ-26]MBU5466189.1 phosphate ABC transporter permease PstA [Virgibacillus sp. MSJ-26]
MDYIDKSIIMKKINTRRWMNGFARGLFFLATSFGLVVLLILIARIISQGIGWINMDFLTGKLSTQVDKAGIFGAVLGTFWLMVVVAPITMFIGVCTAIYIELYMKKGKFKSIIQTNISNLAGVPSIVYGILGLTIFVRLLQLGNVVLAGGLTMSLLVLPIVVIASQEAIRAVPTHLSEASYGLGATKWQTIRNVILPAALPGILTGAILALSRAIGETAPLVVLGIPALLLPFPGGILDKFTVLPMQIYYWTLDSSLTAEYANLAAATIITLLFFLFFLNATAIFIRNKFQKKY